jgi:hypothetical protein
MFSLGRSDHMEKLQGGREVTEIDSESCPVVDVLVEVQILC